MGDATRAVRFRRRRPAPVSRRRDAHLAHAHAPRRTLRLCETRARPRRDVRRLAHRVSSGPILDDAPRRGTVHRPRRVRVRFPLDVSLSTTTFVYVCSSFFFAFAFLFFFAFFVFFAFFSFFFGVFCFLDAA